MVSVATDPSGGMGGSTAANVLGYDPSISGYSELVRLKEFLGSEKVSSNDKAQTLIDLLSGKAGEEQKESLQDALTLSDVKIEEEPEKTAAHLSVIGQIESQMRTLVEEMGKGGQGGDPRLSNALSDLAGALQEVRNSVANGTVPSPNMLNIVALTEREKEKKTKDKNEEAALARRITNYYMVTSATVGVTIPVMSALEAKAAAKELIGSDIIMSGIGNKVRSHMLESLPTSGATKEQTVVALSNAWSVGAEELMSIHDRNLRTIDEQIAELEGIEEGQLTAEQMDRLELLRNIREEYKFLATAHEGDINMRDASSEFRTRVANRIYEQIGEEAIEALGGEEAARAAIDRQLHDVFNEGKSRGWLDHDDKVAKEKRIAELSKLDNLTAEQREELKGLRAEIALDRVVNYTMAASGQESREIIGDKLADMMQTGIIDEKGNIQANEIALNNLRVLRQQHEKGHGEKQPEEQQKSQDSPAQHANNSGGKSEEVGNLTAGSGDNKNMAALTAGIKLNGVTVAEGGQEQDKPDAKTSEMPTVNLAGLGVSLGEKRELPTKEEAQRTIANRTNGNVVSTNEIDPNDLVTQFRQHQQQSLGA